MKQTNFTLLSIAVITICLLTSCGGKLKFEGTFIDKKTESKVLVLKKSGSDYFVTLNGEKLPAKLSDNQLVVDNERTIAIDKETGTIVFLGEDYIPMDGSQFLGRWSFNNRNELMEIKKHDDVFQVLWKSWTDGYMPHVVNCKLEDGVLVGDYYGHQDNFTLKVSGNKQISLSVDPFAEFEPVRNQRFTPTHSIFIVSSGSDFTGFWKHNWDNPGGEQGEITLTVSPNGSDYNVQLALKPHGKWNWLSYYSKEQLKARSNVEGDFPILKLISSDTIMLANFYMMGATEHTLELKNKTVAASPTQSQSANSVNEYTSSTNSNVSPPSNSTAFYIISVAAIKDEQSAKKKSAELKQQGHPSGYLWIPDYASLSGAQFYSVYLGPYSTQYDCEVATEEYRKKHPAAYGVLVSQDKRRVQINGIGKVTVTQK